MSSPAGFVWFDNRSAQPDTTTRFYAELLGWSAVDGPGMKMFAGESGPVDRAGGRVPSYLAVAWGPPHQPHDLVVVRRHPGQQGSTDESRGTCHEDLHRRDGSDDRGDLLVVHPLEVGRFGAEHRFGRVRGRAEPGGRPALHGAPSRGRAIGEP